MLSYVSTFLFIVLEVAIWLTSYIDGLSKYVYGDGPEAFQAFMAYQSTLIVLYLAVRLSIERQDLKKDISPLFTEICEVKNKLKRGVAESLHQEEFYEKFIFEISKSRRTVDITHLDIFPPTAQSYKDSRTEQYFDSFVRTIRNHPRVMFRRVERCSPHKFPWVKQLIDGLSSQRNFSLAFLDTTSTDEKLPEVSVQVVDSEKAFVVAIARHSDAHGPRDMVIEDEKIAKLWLSYYDEVLWKKSIKLIEHGRLQADAWREYQDRVAKMRSA